MYTEETMETDGVYFNPLFRSTTKGNISEKVLKCPRVLVVFSVLFNMLQLLDGLYAVA